MFNPNQPICHSSWYSSWFQQEPNPSTTETTCEAEPEVNDTLPSSASLTSSMIFEDDSVAINRGSPKESFAIEWRRLQSAIDCFESPKMRIGSKKIETFLQFITQGTKCQVFCDLLCDNPNSRKIQELLSWLPQSGEESLYLPLALESSLRSQATVGGAVDALAQATGISIASSSLVMIVLDFKNQRLEYFNPSGQVSSEKEMRLIAGLKEVPLASLLTKLEQKYNFKPKNRVTSPTKWYSYGVDLGASCCWYVQKRLQGQAPEVLFSQSPDAPTIRKEMAERMRAAQKSIELHTPVEIFLENGGKGEVTLGLVKEFPTLITQVLDSLDSPDKIAKQFQRDVPTLAHLKIGDREILPRTYYQRAQVREALQRITWYQIDSTDYNKVLDRILTVIESWEESPHKSSIRNEVGNLRNKQTRIGVRFRQKIKEVEAIKNALLALQEKEQKQDLFTPTYHALKELTDNNEKITQTLLALSTQATLGGEIMFLAGIGQGHETIPHHELIGYSVDIGKNELKEITLTIRRGYNYFDEKGYKFTGDLNIEVNVATGYASAWLDPRIAGLF